MQPRTITLSLLLLFLAACNQLEDANTTLPGSGGSDTLAPTGTFGVSASYGGPYQNDAAGSIEDSADARIVSVAPGGTFFIQVNYEDTSGITDIAVNLVNSSPEGLAGTLDPSQSFFTLGEPTGVSEPNGCDLSGSPKEVSCIYEVRVAEDAVNITELDGSADEFAYVFRTKVTDAAGNTSDKAERGYVVVMGGEPSDKVVNVPDPVLEQLIRTEISKSEGDLTEQDLEKVETIEFEAKGLPTVDTIQNLEGLQFAVNLSVLDVSFNDFGDLTPLVNNPGLGEGDYLEFFQTPLDTCPGTEARNAIDTLIERGATVNFDEPENCDVDGGEVVQIPDALLERLIRKEVNKSDGALTEQDLAKVKELFNDAPFDSGVRSLEGLQFAVNLENLGLPFNSVSDLSPLEDLAQLVDLNFIANPITDLSPLVRNEDFAEGDFLDVTEIRMLDTCPGSGAREDIETLTERGANVDFDEPEDCDVDGGKVVNIPDPVLERVIRNEIGKAEGDLTKQDLAELVTVQYEGKFTVRIRSLEGLQFAVNLEVIDITFNAITDLTPLQNLANLKTLNFAISAIDDISPLVKNENLGEGVTISLVDSRLDTCPGSDDREDIDALIGRGVEVSFDESETCNG